MVRDGLIDPELDHSGLLIVLRLILNTLVLHRENDGENIDNF